LAGTEYAGDDRWLAAALLHDIGKIDAHLSVFGRVAATMAGLSMSREAAADWSRGRGFRRRIGLYLRHPEVGADRIAIIGGQPVAVTWARVHHDRFAWSTTDLPEPVIAALDAADND
jgi:hypothetical protein